MLLNACKDIGLAVNTGKTKKLEMGLHRGMIANEHIKICSNSYEKVKNFKCLGSLLANQNYIQEEIKCKLKAGNSCYSVKTHLSSRILSRNLEIKVYKAIILPVVLYGCENGLIHKGRNATKGIRKQDSGPKRDGNREWRRLHKEELHTLHLSPNIVRGMKSRRLRWAGHAARTDEGRRAFKILTRKPTGKRHLGRLRHRWEDNIRIDLEVIGISAWNWVDPAQDRNYWRVLVNTALNLRLP